MEIEKLPRASLLVCNPCVTVSVWKVGSESIGWYNQTYFVIWMTGSLSSFDLSYLDTFGEILDTVFSSSHIFISLHFTPIDINL